MAIKTFLNNIVIMCWSCAKFNEKSERFLKVRTSLRGSRLQFRTNQGRLFTIDRYGMLYYWGHKVQPYRKWRVWNWSKSLFWRSGRVTGNGGLAPQTFMWLRSCSSIWANYPSVLFYTEISGWLSSLFLLFSKPINVFIPNSIVLSSIVRILY